MAILAVVYVWLLFVIMVLGYVYIKITCDWI